MYGKIVPDKKLFATNPPEEVKGHKKGKRKRRWFVSKIKDTY